MSISGATPKRKQSKRSVKPPAKKRPRSKKSKAAFSLPPEQDWRTTDADEVNRRRKRAREESFVIRNGDARFPVFSNFSVGSGSGLTYSVEIRDVTGRVFACSCQDFRKNGLGTCKHVEAVLWQLQKRLKSKLTKAVAVGSERVDIVPDDGASTLRIERGLDRLPKRVRDWFGGDGLLNGTPVEDALAGLGKLRDGGLGELRISQEIQPWLEERLRRAERKELRREYELKVQSGEWPVQETRVPLFPYQREGMLHLAFAERALLADEMGLGKTIQAIAACALLKRLGRVARVLVVTPASLKGEWEDQIALFTDLPTKLVFGKLPQRRVAYDEDTFFTIVNYEQMIRDSLLVNERFRPDVVVLDEAQRIKNWNTQTAQAIKRLHSRYAFVLTGTPIENRIDELYSLMDFLDPRLLGPLFRFNREFYRFDERGRPSGYQNLEHLQQRVAPSMLRRRKSEVETELPDRTDHQHFVKMTPKQEVVYGEHSDIVARLAATARRRPLTKQEQDRMMINLAMMRMVCDTPYILDPEVRDCPKLKELETVLEECRDNDGVKVIVFSEWEKMLELVKETCDKLKLGSAWHTGSVPQQNRRKEIARFKNDPECRVFLSTDSGSTGLNLQNASVVINCDLPWNPAKLEQRIARAWRKHQTRAVTVINLVAENTIEHRMLETLANKQALADGVLDKRGDLSAIPMRSGGQAFLAKLNQLVGDGTGPTAATDDKSEISNSKPADPPVAFAVEAKRRLGDALIRCEELFSEVGEQSVVYVVVDDGALALRRREIEAVYAELLGDGKDSIQLELVGRATDEALRRLVSARLFAPVDRARRLLNPGAEAPPELTEEELGIVKEHRELAARKLRMARLLADGGFAEEAREPMLDSAGALAFALAVERRLPEPGSAEDSLLPPGEVVWNGHHDTIQQYIDDPESDGKAVAELIESFLKSK